MESYYDEYEHYNFMHDKYINTSHSGKGRSKKEAGLNTNRPDPCGHRKALNKIINNSMKQKCPPNGKKV